MALDATVGGASANSYATELEANIYHQGHVAGADWLLAAAPQDALKEAALIQATRMLDAHLEWDGDVATTTQALLWPRIGVLSRSGLLIASDVIPTALKQATAELARQLLVEDRSADSDIETQGLTSLKAGPVELTFKDTVIAKPIPDAVYALIRHFGTLRTVGGARSVLVERV